VRLEDVAVRTRPEEGKKPAHIQIPLASIGISPLAQLRGELAWSARIEALDGEIDADVTTSRARGIVKLATRKLSLAELPGARDAIKVPLAGRVDLAVDMLLPGNRNAEAKGTVSWQCAGCAIGDGREKLQIPGNPMMAEGITVPRIRLGDLTGAIAFDKGAGRLQAVRAASPDLDLRIDGEIKLADPIAYSQIDLYVTFKASDALLRGAEKLRLLLQLSESMGKRPDGYYGFRLMGTLARVTSLRWSKTSPFQAGPGEAGARQAPAGPPRARPSPEAPPPPPPPPAPPSPPAEPAAEPAAPPPPSEPAAPPPPSGRSDPEKPPPTPEQVPAPSTPTPQ
jgi:type II secretion system protein N